MVVVLNDREQKLLQVAWQCMDVQPKTVTPRHPPSDAANSYRPSRQRPEPPYPAFTSVDPSQIDYDKLAQLSGLGTKGSATTAWCVLKKKLAGEQGVSTPGRATTPKTTPRKTGAGKGKNGPGISTPSKRKAGVEDGDADDDDDDDDNEMSQVEKRGKKAKTGAVKVEDGAVVLRAAVMGDGDGAGKPVVKEEAGEEELSFLQGARLAAAEGN